MSENLLSEAFKDLSFLNEDTFTFDAEGAERLKDFMDDDSLNEIETVIDADAETEDELEDSYIGKAILCCDVCHSMVYKDPEEIEIDEETQLANVGEDCPYCYNSEGFKIIGQVAELDLDDTDEEDEVSDDTDDVVDIDNTEKVDIKESLNKKRRMQMAENYKRARRNRVKEDFKKVDIETDKERLSMTSDNNGKVVVTTEPNETYDDEVIADDEFISDETIVPVSDEVKAEIEDNGEAEDTDITDVSVDGADEDEEEDIDIDEFDEESFDAIGESYLSSVYDNVKNYHTSSVKIDDTSLLVEGVIEFNNGRKVPTKFMFEAKCKTPRGKLKFVGANKEITESKKSFVITGSVQDKKLLTESLTYNYKVRGYKERVYGTVKR